MDPFDLAQYPEEVHGLIEQARQRYEEAQQAAEKWKDIDADPDKVKNAVTMYDSYTNDHDGRYRAAMAEKWGILQPGQTLDDLRAINEQIAAYQQAQQASMFADPDEIDPQQFVQHLDSRYVTPDKLAELEAKVAGEIERRESEADARALANQERDLYKRLEQDGVEVSPREREIVQAILDHRIRTDKVDGNNFHTAFEDAWNDARGMIDEQAKKLMTEQSRKPRTESREGVTPGTSTPVTDIKSAVKAFAERMALED